MIFEVTIIAQKSNSVYEGKFIVICNNENEISDLIHDTYDLGGLNILAIKSVPVDKTQVFAVGNFSQIK